MPLEAPGSLYPSASLEFVPKRMHWIINYRHYRFVIVWWKQDG